MKISYKWLLELTGLDWPVEEVSEKLTLSGTACEDIVPLDRYMDKVVVGEVLDLNPIKGADKIRLATVDIGKEKFDLVCGAPNVAKGQKVPVALEGAHLAGDIAIKKTKIRGIESRGMICSERELGLSEDHSGILVLDKNFKAGQALKDVLEVDDYTLDFELTPNRADSTSAIGIARDLAVLGGVELKKPTYDIKEDKEKASDHIKVDIDDPHGCPRYAARVIKNIKIGPSPWWVKRKLITAGIRPISNVVDITNLVMLETGNPLHAFDLKLFGSDRVLVRKAMNKEKFTTLDGKEHELTPEVLLITNGKDGVAAGGVMGGLNSEVVENTDTILLEAAYFDPMVVRRSRRHLGLVTESSIRFEKGSDPNNVPYAMNRAAYLFQELCGGTVLQGMVDCYPSPVEKKTVPFRPERCNAVLGTDFPKKDMLKIFEGLEFEVAENKKIEVTIPTFRHDIEREIDLIEEVARLKGFNAIPDAVKNIGPLYTPVHFEDRFLNEIRQVMTGGGFDEIMGHGLADSRQAKKLNPELPQLKIINPVSEDLDIMRNCLALTALGSIQHNLAHRNMNLRLFELGRAYFPPDKKKNWVEDDRLLITVTGDTETTWRDKPRPMDFYDVKTALENLAEHFHWPEYRFEAHPVYYLNSEISFEIKAGDESLGAIGLVNEEIARIFDIKQPVFLAEISLKYLISISDRMAAFQPLPVYPAAPRDLALVVKEETRVADLIEVIRDNAGELAEAVDVFDLYSGKQIEKGKKSVGISITYRSAERSLASEEIDQMQQKIIKALKKNFDIEVRDK